MGDMASNRPIFDSPLDLQERKRVAAIVGIGEPYLYQCLTGRRDMNPARALRFENATGGILNRKVLCRSTYADIWPELVEAHG